MYILLCANGQYYTGSTKNLDLRIKRHSDGKGANFTSKHLPVELVYYEKFQRIQDAFLREKQIHNWSHKKKEALIHGDTKEKGDASKETPAWRLYDVLFYLFYLFSLFFFAFLVSLFFFAFLVSLLAAGWDVFFVNELVG